VPPLGGYENIAIFVSTIISLYRVLSTMRPSDVVNRVLADLASRWSSCTALLVQGALPGAGKNGPGKNGPGKNGPGKSSVFTARRVCIAWTMSGKTSVCLSVFSSVTRRYLV